MQSVATRLVVDREREIQQFVPREYWNITAFLSQKDEDQNFQAKFYGDLNGNKIELPNQETVDKILSQLKDSQYTVKSVKIGKKSKSPHLLLSPAHFSRRLIEN